MTRPTPTYTRAGPARRAPTRKVRGRGLPVEPTAADNSVPVERSWSGPTRLDGHSPEPRPLCLFQLAPRLAWAIDRDKAYAVAVAVAVAALELSAGQLGGL